MELTYRLFIAVEVPPKVKADLTVAQEQLRGGGAPVKWVAPEAMHITLHFLGETKVALLPPLGAALAAALARHRPIGLRIAGAGAFPNLRRPNVIWAGIAGATAELGRIQAASGKALESLDLPRETRQFRAHLTLGRVRREATPAQQEQLGMAIRSLPALAPLPWNVDRVVLFRSELRPDGPVYTEIRDWRLELRD
jgi:2'-5' RNA ligase